MSMATLERAILAGAKFVLNNPRLKMKDIQEWSSGEIEPHKGEVVVRVSDPGVYVAVKVESDKREGAGGDASACRNVVLAAAAAVREKGLPPPKTTKSAPGKRK